MTKNILLVLCVTALVIVESGSNERGKCHLFSMLTPFMHACMHNNDDDDDNDNDDDDDDDDDDDCWALDSEDTRLLGKLEIPI